MKYDTGTVTVTNGSSTVTGAGTSWLANISAGQMFTIVGSGVAYDVAAVIDDVTIQLSAPYADVTAGAQAYVIVQSFTPKNNIPYPEIGDVQTATILKRAIQTIDSALGLIPVFVGEAPTPSTAPILYYDSSDGWIRWKFPNGIVKEVVNNVAEPT